MKSPTYLSSITFTISYVLFYYWMYHNGYLSSMPPSNIIAITTMIMMSSNSQSIMKGIRRLIFLKNTIDLLS